jgi:hypothetical protein
MDPAVLYLQTPATVVNEAIYDLGEPGKVIGDINDGTSVSEAARYAYGRALRQLLRTAPWDFGRKQAVLTLLGDATTTNPPLGVSSFVEQPWAFAYEWPIDCVMGRWLPWNPTNAQPENNDGTPLTTGVSSIVYYNMIPGRFLVSSSDQYPVVTGNQDWDQLPDLQRTEGVSYVNRKIILTNCCNAHFVYTRLVTEIEMWDALFRQAFVMMLALALVQVIIDDPKERLVQRDRLVPLLRNAIADARVANGQESSQFQSVDFEASFLAGRSSGIYGWANTYPGFGGTAATGGYGMGYNGCGWDFMNFGGNAY